MDETAEQKTSTLQSKNEQNDSSPQNKNLQDNRASILEKHLHKNKSVTNSSKDLEINKIKEEINKIKKGETSAPVIEQTTDEYTQLVNKTLFQFRNEINSPINSIEYSTENLKLEYERIINYFQELADSAYPTEALSRALEYVNQMDNTSTQSDDATELRERKKTFVDLLKEYEFKNTNKAADYFISSGVYFIDDELFWIFSQPKAEILFDLMVSILSIRQSFEILRPVHS